MCHNSEFQYECQGHWNPQCFGINVLECTDQCVCEFKAQLYASMYDPQAEPQSRRFFVCICWCTTQSGLWEADTHILCYYAQIQCRRTGIHFVPYVEPATVVHLHFMTTYTWCEIPHRTYVAIMLSQWRSVKIFWVTFSFLINNRKQQWQQEIWYMMFMQFNLDIFVFICRAVMIIMKPMFILNIFLEHWHHRRTAKQSIDEKTAPSNVTVYRSTIDLKLSHLAHEITRLPR